MALPQNQLLVCREKIILKRDAEKELIQNEKYFLLTLH